MAIGMTIFRSLFHSLAALVLALVAAAPASAHEGRSGGKLMLTDGIASIDGAAGGGLASWAVIAGSETKDGIGATANATLVALPDFDLTAHGAAVGVYDRLELSYAHQRFDTRAAGKALGLGRNFAFSQDIVGAKLRIAGDAVWGQGTILPQIAIGVQHHIAAQAPVIRAVGGRRATTTDVYAAATKVLLARSLVVDATARWTDANQFGLLGGGGGGDRGVRRSLHAEASAGYLVTRRLLVGGEYRGKPDNLGFAREGDAVDLFAAWAVRRHLTATAAYVDLGDIATFRRQRGLFLSLKGGF